MVLWQCEGGTEGVRVRERNNVRSFAEGVRM